MGKRAPILAVPRLEHRSGGQRHARVDKQNGSPGEIVLDLALLGAGAEAKADGSVALGAGLLVGLERERRKGQGDDRQAAGLRTFTVAALAAGAGFWCPT